jgi:hypothetical protein
MKEGLRLLEQRGGVTFVDCLVECIHTSEFVSEWQRLSGKKLLATNPLDRMVDKATGYDMSVIGEFADFVYDYVFKTLPEA